jgi:hypothetical protein
MTDVDHTGHQHDYNVPSHAESASEQVEFDREIQYHQLVAMGIGLLVVALLSGVLVFYMLRGLIRWRDQQDGPPPVVTSAPTEMTAPKLLARPPLELQTLRDAENEQLDSYGWVDQKQGVARIPVARAIDIAAEKGLPNVSSGTAAPAAAAPAPVAVVAAPAAATPKPAAAPGGPQG